MFIWTKSSAHRVFPNLRKDRDDVSFLSLVSGRNMHASGQILVREHWNFSVKSMEITGIPAEWVTFYRQEYTTYNDGMPYPDRLSPVLAGEVKSHVTQSLWVVVCVPADAEAGLYKGEVTVYTEGSDNPKIPVTLQVFPVTLPDAADGTYDHEYFFTYTDMSRFDASIERYSERWWNIMTSYAKAMKRLRVNNLDLTLLGLLAGEGTYRTGVDTWQFNFERADAFIEHFFAHGSFRRIVLGAPTSSLMADKTYAVDENGKGLTLDTRSEEGEAFLRAYFAAVREHFTEKGWYDITATHLSDEPHESGNWLWLRSLVAEVCPGMPITEPMDTYEPTLDMAEACDEFIPRLEVYEQGKDFYDKRAAAGKRLWCYSCCFPEQHWFLNKFIDLPHHWSRLIHWACYSNNITGFLHWGFNYWGGEMYGIAPMARFKGDGFIVYPDKENECVQFSNRALATWEGIEEYELMRILAEKQPETVKAVCTGMAAGFHEFEADPDALDCARNELFGLLNFCG
ncbi:MAG: DUF4091 domain-containing protein [Clostridia bacterium]|nr:DUF4091 domain-containing protein [Clostridia bacterium]